MSRGSGRRSHRPDSSLSVLLDLDGTKIGVGTQYWVKISAWVIEPDEKVTADKLAKILGGTASIASCDKK